MAEQFIPSGKKHHLRKGQYLFREGDDSEDLYVIRFGRMRIFKTEAEVEIELTEAGKGSVVGEVAAIDGGKRSASAMALEETELLVVPADDFRKIMTKIPEWFSKIAVILVQRLREVDKRIYKTINENKESRIISLIALMAYCPLAEKRSGRIVISPKDLENDLMDILHVQPSDITHALASLSQRGLIELGGGKISIKDVRKLERENAFCCP